MTTPSQAPSANFAIVILAAGKGTRLKSKLPKVLHQIAGLPLLAHVIAAARQVTPAENIFCVVGYEAERVRSETAALGTQFVEQSEQKGTGHALMQCRQGLAGVEHVLVLSGDVPLIRPQTIARLRDFHLAHKAAMTILTAEPADPFGYGRIVRGHGDGGDEVVAIVEQKQANAEQTSICEINSGIYAFDVKALFARIERLGTDNPHREYYLTDMAAILRDDGQRVLALKAADAVEVMGVNTRRELANLDRLLRARKAADLMENGVTIYRPETCVIDALVKVGSDTVIEPFVQLLGASTVGENCRIRSYSVLTNARIADSVTVRQHCVAEDVAIGSRCIVGPFTHLRPGSELGEGAHVGNFVETKKARIGRGSKANHLTYLGDAEIGEGVNIGAGTITCNYDGVNKHPTTIEDGAFIGSDTTLVAPVTVGKGAYVGAGSCITKPVPPDSLAITRPPQVIKEGWAARKREQQRKKS